LLLKHKAAWFHHIPQISLLRDVGFYLMKWFSMM